MTGSTALLLCVYCSTEFDPREPGHVGKWCCDECRDADSKMRDRLRKQAERAPSADDGTLPPEPNGNGMYWNGRMQYSNPGPMTYPYVRKCFLCGRHPEIEWLTDRQTRLLSLAGIGACEVCGGWRFLDLQEVGGMGSPTKAAPARTVAEPVRPVRHHAA